jgi:hypothetical protein
VPHRDRRGQRRRARDGGGPAGLRYGRRRRRRGQRDRIGRGRGGQRPRRQGRQRVRCGRAAGRGGLDPGLGRCHPRGRGARRPGDRKRVGAGHATDPFWTGSTAQPPATAVPGPGVAGTGEPAPGHDLCPEVGADLCPEHRHKAAAAPDRECGRCRPSRPSRPDSGRYWAVSCKSAAAERGGASTTQGTERHRRARNP